MSFSLLGTWSSYLILGFCLKWFLFYLLVDFLAVFLFYFILSIPAFPSFGNFLWTECALRISVFLSVAPSRGPLDHMLQRTPSVHEFLFSYIHSAGPAHLLIFTCVVVNTFSFQGLWLTFYRSDSCTYSKGSGKVLFCLHGQHFLECELLFAAIRTFCTSFW